MSKVKNTGPGGVRVKENLWMGGRSNILGKFLFGLNEHQK